MKMDSNLILSENSSTLSENSNQQPEEIEDSLIENKLVDKTLKLNLNYNLIPECSQLNYNATTTTNQSNINKENDDSTAIKFEEENPELVLMNMNRDEMVKILEDLLSNENNNNFDDIDEKFDLQSEIDGSTADEIKLTTVDECNNELPSPEIVTDTKTDSVHLTMCVNCQQIYFTDYFNSHTCNIFKNQNSDNTFVEQNNEIDQNLTNLSGANDSQPMLIAAPQQLPSPPQQQSLPPPPPAASAAQSISTSVPPIQISQPYSSVIIDESIKINKPEIPFEILKPQCIKLMTENNSFIHKWLKSDYKCDITQINNENNDDKSELNKSIQNKISGPYICELCDRKFVHASGLERHITKHQEENLLSTSNNTTDNVKEFVTLKIVIKCLFCSRIFQHIDDAIEHIIEDHTLSDDINQQKEWEMYSDQKAMNKKTAEIIQQQNVNVDDDDNNDNKNINNNVDDGEQRFIKVIILSSVLQCEFCDYLFPNVNSLLLHSGSHDPKYGYECNKCEIKFSNIKEYLKHTTYECIFIRYGSESMIGLPKYFTCNVCENKFTSLNELYEHRHKLLHLFPRKSEHKNEMLFLLGCESCGKLFEKAKSYILHYQEDHVKKTVKKRNDSVVERNNILKSTDDNENVAGGGGGGNHDGDNQNTETVSITKSRKYLCDVCGKSYTQSSHLWQHLRFHQGVKPFECKEPNCTRRFTIRPDLNDHIRKCHTGERPYHCEICGKRFLTGSVYYQHRLIHRGERRYGCEDCGKRFYRADALKNHQRIHTGEKPFPCPQCPKCFRQRGDRDKHVRVRHSNIPIVKSTNAKNRYRSMTAPQNRV